MISGRNALFLMFTPDGIMRSDVSSTSMLSVIAFGSFPHKFSGIGISKFLQICQLIMLQTLLCRCVYSCLDFFLLLLFSCSVIKRHISFSLLTPPPLLTCRFFFLLSPTLLSHSVPSSSNGALSSHISTGLVCQGG